MTPFQQVESMLIATELTPKQAERLIFLAKANTRITDAGEIPPKKFKHWLMPPMPLTNRYRTQSGQRPARKETTWQQAIK